MNQYLASLSEARELQRQRVFSHRPDPRDIPDAFRSLPYETR